MKVFHEKLAMFWIFPPSFWIGNASLEKRQALFQKEDSMTGDTAVSVV